MGNTRTRNAVSNIFISMVTKFLTLILQFLSRILFLRVLSVSYLGINGLFTNILSVLSLADLGMHTAMTYSLYKPLANNNKEKIAQLIYFYKKIYTMISIGVLVVGSILTPFIKYIVNLEEELPYLEIYYLLFLMNSVISYLFVYRTTLIIADQKEFLLGKIRVIYQIINFLSINICLFVFKNYILYLLIGNVCRLIENIVESRFVIKQYPYIEKANKKISNEEKKEIFSNVKSLFLYKFSSIIQGNTDNILISLFAGTITVGYYSNYSLIINGIVMLISTLFGAFKSGVGNLLASENSDSYKYKLFKSLDLLSYWMTASCSIILLVLFNDLILMMFGEEFILSIEIVTVIVINFYTSNVRQAIWTYRETTGIFSQTKYITLVTAILNLGLSIIGGRKFGLFGIILATIIARLVYAWWKEPQILFGYYFKKSPMVYYRQYIFNFLIFSGVSIFIYSLCGLVSFDNLLLNIIIKLGISVVVFNTVFIFVYWKNEEFQFVLSKFLQILRRKM